LEQSGVLARAVLVAGGFVGCADLVFHDSPPLAGWPSSAVVSFLRFGRCRVTSVTRCQNQSF
jgi:hypothetical protein